ncbi:hypothetical protein J437_LFUL000241, partial [Ladona fulva]
MVELDAFVRSNMGLNHADCDKALQYMDEMDKLPISPLMLKKNPMVVETARRLRLYVGNHHKWNMSDAEKGEFIKKTAVVRMKADHLYNKFKSLFMVPESKSFIKDFGEQVEMFQEATKHLTKEQKYALVYDPSVGEKSNEKEATATEEAEVNQDEADAEKEKAADQTQNTPKEKKTPGGVARKKSVSVEETDKEAS